MGKGRGVEIALDAAVAAWIGGSVGFALAAAGDRLHVSSYLAVSAALGVALALLTYRVFTGMRRPQYHLPSFELQPVQPVEPDAILEELLLTAELAVPVPELLLTGDMMVLTSELLLTRGQMLNPPAEDASSTLLLDDVLAELQPDSRVVQLFDSSRIPTAGELKSRIDRHLSEAGRAAVRQEPDASQALYDALADLRRSLG